MTALLSLLAKYSRAELRNEEDSSPEESDRAIAKYEFQNIGI